MPRVFFALWPTREAREALARHGAGLAKASGGRAVPEANLHLTLVFLGEVAPGRIDLLRRAAGTVEARRFALTLDRLGSFRGSGVGWAGCEQPAHELLALQAALSSALAAEGIVSEERPYAPHLTLVRRISAAIPPAAIEAVTWEVATFALVESRRERGGYATVGEWPMGA